METQVTSNTTSTTQSNDWSSQSSESTNRLNNTTEVPTTHANEFSKESVDRNSNKTDTEETPKDTRKYTFKRNGVEEEVDEETYTKYAQKAWAADKTLAEAKKMQRELSQREAEILEYQRQIHQLRQLKPSQRINMMLEELQDNPEALNDFRGSIENWLLQQIDIESASEETKRALKAEKELERVKRQQEEHQNNLKRAAWERAVAEQRPKQEKMVIDTIKAAKLPVTEWNIKSIADLYINAIKNGQNPKPEQVAQAVKEDRIDHIRAFAGQYAKEIAEAYSTKDMASVAKIGEAMTDVFGEDIIKALRYYDVAMLEKKAPNLPKKVVETPRQEMQKTGAYEFGSYDEYQEYRRRNAMQK